ncbi:NADH-quinone oxidoreductase subunit J family protein [Stetteria hydrogenophila]
MGPQDYYPYMAAMLSGVMLVAAYYVVKCRDLVYASIALAALSSMTAAFAALLGFGLVAAFIIIVYVGAAVMFIILSLSMLGIRESGARSRVRGILAALGGLAGFLYASASTGLFKAYARPDSFSAADVAEAMLARYLPVVWILVVTLAATLLEAVAIARRGG